MEKKIKEYIKEEEIVRLTNFLREFFIKNNLSPDEILGLLVSTLVSGISNISSLSVEKDDTFALDRILRHVTIPTLANAINKVANDLKVKDRYEINCTKYNLDSVN